MTALDFGFDALLAAVIPFLAWRVLASDDLPKSIVLFIALGLVSALSWARLDAPDIALVEAAIGAGLTGALLMNALGWIPPMERLAPRQTRVWRVVLALVLFALAIGLAAVILELPQHAGLAGLVAERLPDSGVGHSVTAVLLNFRGYDTLLEVAVLAVAAIAARLHAPHRPTADSGQVVDPLGPHVAVLARLLVPMMILVAGYLLWRGANAPGGAFQAAAVLGAGGILLVLSRALRPPMMSSRLVRGILVVGFAWFLVMAAMPLASGRQLLEYPPELAGGLIFSIELVLTLSIAGILLMFFPGEATAAAPRTRAELEDRW